MSDTSLLSPALSLIATLKAELTALTAERDAIRVCFAEASHEAGPGRVRVEMELATVTKERDAALARAAEHQARLIGYLDSPEGANFVAAQQRDTANRVADELENELAAVTAERDMLNTAENRRAIGLGFSKDADEEITRLHEAFDEVQRRLSAERDAALERAAEQRGTANRVVTELEKELVVLAAERDEAKAELRALKQVCEVCWTSSYEPCEEADEGAEAYKDGTGFVSCSMCKLVEGLKKCIAERDALRAAVTQAIVWLGDTYVEGANIRIRCADVLQATLDVFAKHPEGQV